MLIYRHLVGCGYIDAAANLGRECNIDLAKWEAADNIDLGVIMQEYESFYEMRFLKKPVLVRRSADDEPPLKRKITQGGMLPKIPNSAKPPAGNVAGNAASKVSLSSKNSAAGRGKFDDFSVQGT